MSKKYNLVKKYYNSGFWTTEMVFNAIDKGWIAEEEYNEIVQIEETTEEIQEENQESAE